VWQNALVCSGLMTCAANPAAQRRGRSPQPGVPAQLQRECDRLPEHLQPPHELLNPADCIGKAQGPTDLLPVGIRKARLLHALADADPDRAHDRPPWIWFGAIGSSLGRHEPSTASFVMRGNRGRGYPQPAHGSPLMQPGQHCPSRDRPPHDAIRCPGCPNGFSARPVEPGEHQLT
jgi:hypothetical protein